MLVESVSTISWLSEKGEKTLQLIEFGNLGEPHMLTNRWVCL